jgi:hypothetical protein
MSAHIKMKLFWDLTTIRFIIAGRGVFLCSLFLGVISISIFVGTNDLMVSGY